jgi:hypothetical protein
MKPNSRNSRTHQVAVVELERLVSDRVKVPQKPPLPESRGYCACRRLFTVSVSLLAIGSVGGPS